MSTPTHSTAYRFRRFLNWFPLGLTYAFLYMGRYNLTVAKNALGELMTKAEFGEIFGVGAVVYGFAFLINGPLTDRMGGRFAMLLGAAGSIGANLMMGLVLFGITNWGWQLSVFWSFTLLYALNMYFQSFGAVAIVSVKAPWFHVRERGGFSTIFSIMISLGIYFAFDWGAAVMQATRAGVDTNQLGLFAGIFHALLPVNGSVDANWWLFFTPASFLTLLWVVLFFLLRNTPGQAGFEDFDTGEEAIAEEGEHLPVQQLFVRIITHPVLGVICVIEFCSGVLRNGIMQWYKIFAKDTGFYHSFFVTDNWGLLLMFAGITGAFLTGWASDKFFHSRRAPMATILYGVIAASVLGMAFGLEANHWVLGIQVLLISMAVIGVHGIMSGTSTVDFGGAKNAGAVVGIVDGLVYLGTGLQSFAIGQLAPQKPASADPGAWIAWPLFLIPFAFIGMLMAMRIWNALPKKAKAEA